MNQREPNHEITRTRNHEKTQRSADESSILLPDFALDCGYMSQDNRDRLTAGYEEVGKMLSGMMSNPNKFAPRAIAQ